MASHILKLCHFLHETDTVLVGDEAVFWYIGDRSTRDGEPLIWYLWSSHPQETRRNDIVGFLAWVLQRRMFADAPSQMAEWITADCWKWVCKDVTVFLTFGIPPDNASPIDVAALQLRSPSPCPSVRMLEPVATPLLHDIDRRSMRIHITKSTPIIPLLRRVIRYYRRGFLLSALENLPRVTEQQLIEYVLEQWRPGVVSLLKEATAVPAGASTAADAELRELLTFAFQARECHSPEVAKELLRHRVAFAVPFWMYRIEALSL